MISLKDLLDGSFSENNGGFIFSDVAVRGIECDSRKVQKDFIFFAIRGTKIDGGEFAREAVERGAAGIVVDRRIELPGKTPVVFVEDCRLAMAKAAAKFYREPSLRMNVIGITGTNGKTTSSYLVEHLLNKQQKKTGVLGTINYRFGGKAVPAVETTPGPLRIQEILSQMADAACEYAVMEVSSHALHQHRVGGIDFKAALFTNLTQDHLDYHGSLENYFGCKAKLFTGLGNGCFSVINRDDDWGRKLEGMVSSKIMTYGIDRDADIRAEKIDCRENRTFFEMAFKGRKISVNLPLIGRHNIYNALGALTVLSALGFDLEKCAGDLADFKTVPGRLEAVEAGQDFFVYIDFAHTPDGLENVLETLKPYKKNRLIVLFGCGGDRDKGKRPKMGKIAALYADHVFVTSDNPRSEDPKAIAKEIRDGFPDGFKNFSVAIDRKKAIRQAFLSARKGDIVLLAGKGHETSQIIGKEIFSFNDRLEAEKVLSGH